MKSAAPKREVKTKGLEGRASFGISRANEAHVMSILRDTLYTDKVLAVLREYASNAWDSHRQSGIPDKPIKVCLPTPMEPTLIIRDFGNGLSERGVFDVYTQYGMSTKRDTNDSVGMLGIGSKSGFAYSDSFSITSWHGGMKSIYVAVLDVSDKGEIQKLHEELCGDETGIEIKIAVRPKDIYTFEATAKPLFRYFMPQPDINTTLDEPPKAMVNGFLVDGGKDWIAVMGCVPYRLNINQITTDLDAAGLKDAIGHLSGGIYLDIGAVQVVASREELKYSDTTNKVLVEKLMLLVAEYVEDALKVLTQKDNGVNSWQKRIKACFMHHTLNFPLPQRYKPWTLKRVPLWDKGAVDAKPPKTFRLFNAHKQPVYMISLGEAATVVVGDGGHSLRGYSLHTNDYFVQPNAGCTGADVRKELGEMLKRAGMDGIRILSASLRHWYIRSPIPGVDANPKHKVNSFRLITTDAEPCSANWTIDKRVPTDEDVFVIISEFKAIGCPSFWDMVRGDRVLARHFGLSLPEIYGYKTTSRKPLGNSDCTGTHYMDWRIKTFGDLMTEKVKADLLTLDWADMVNHVGVQGRNIRKWWQTTINALEASLGTKHPMTRLFTKHTDAVKACKRIRHSDILRVLARITRKGHQKAPDMAIRRLMKQYPMIALTSTSSSHNVNQLLINVGCSSNRQLITIINYIKLVDEQETQP